MPAAVIGAIGAAAGWTAATIATVTAVTQVALFIGGLALSNQQKNQAKRKQREAYNAAQVDRMANVVTTVAQREMVLGRARKGGAVYFRGSAGAYKDTFMAHLALAGHEIDGIDEIYLNDVRVYLDADGNVLNSPYAQVRRESYQSQILSGNLSVVLQHTPIAGTVKATAQLPGNGEDSLLLPPFTVSGRTVTLGAVQPTTITVSYQANVTYYYAKIWWELGSENAPADGTTGAYFPDLWSANHRARGVAKLFAQFTYNDTAFPTGVPLMTAVIRGAKVYDPRTGLTAWSDNPALLCRHVYQHPKFGKATVSAAEDERFIAAANACDTPHVWTLTDGTSVTAPLYRASLVVPYGTPAMDAIRDLCQAMAGTSAWAGGELYPKAGVFTASVMSLTDADLAVVQRDGDNERQESVSVSVHRERAQKFNVVNARIWDQEQGYKQVGLQPYKAAALIARDGQELAQEVTMPAVFFAPQAKHVAGVALRDARDPLAIRAPFKLRAYPLELFDTVDLTLERYGWAAKNFSVLERTWDREMGVIWLTLKETAAQIYTPDAAFDPEGYAPNTSLPNPLDIEPPLLKAENITSSGADLKVLSDGSFLTRVRVTWPPLTNASITVGGFIDLQWQEVGTGNWVNTTLSGGTSDTYLEGPVDGTAILVRARSRNELATSDWSLQILHVVIGKSAPPAAPTGVALTRDKVIFTPPADRDVKGFRISAAEGRHTNPSVATPLHGGLVTASPWPLPSRLYGLQTVFVVAVDVVGNESAAGYATQDQGLPDAANIAHEYDFAAAGWPGTIQDGSVVDGVLLADEDPETPNFWGNGRGRDFWYLDGSTDFWGGTQYLSLVYSAVYGCPYAGGAVLIDYQMVGARTTIEARIDGSTEGDFWDDSRPDFWGSDIASFWGESGEFRPWNGSITPTQVVGYEFRLTVDGGSTQGSITAFQARTEVPQIEQVFGRVNISAAGTVINPANGTPPLTFRRIDDVQVTPIGPNAVGGRVKNYPIDPTTGPEVELISPSGVPVDGPALVRLSGF